MLTGVIVYRKLGFTFIETLITIVILAIALSALTTALSSSVVQSASPIVERKALVLAQAYIDEILPLKFDDQSPQEGGEVNVASAPCTISTEGQGRAAFDDVDDYHGLIDQPPQFIQASFDLAQYSGYSVTVNVSCSGTSLGLSQNHLAKRITVIVRTPNNDVRNVSVYRGNF